MAFYYVKSGGTATADAGRATTARTGSFATMGASAYYDSVYDVFAGLVPTTAPDGDVIIVADDHAESTTLGDHALGVKNTTDDAMSIVVSMDATDVSVYKKGATVSTLLMGNIYLCSSLDQNNFVLFKGFVFNSIGSFIATSDDSIVDIEDCTINHSTWQDSTGFNSFVNCVLNIGSLRTGFSTDMGGMFGCTINCTNGSYLSYQTSGSFYNCDFSGCTSSNISEPIKMVLHKCKMPTGWNVSTTQDWDYIFKSTGCGDANEYYDYYYSGFTGEITTDIAIYLNATYDSTNEFSITLETLATANISNPIRHKLVELPAQDLTTAKTYTVNFQSDTTLTDTEFWLEVVRPDATDNALGVIQSSRNSDILATGTTHTTNSESWSGTAKTNQYEDSISVSGMTGVDNANVEIWVNIAKPSIDVWVCPDIGIADVPA